MPSTPSGKKSGAKIAVCLANLRSRGKGTSPAQERTSKHAFPLSLFSLGKENGRMLGSSFRILSGPERWEPKPCNHRGTWSPSKQDFLMEAGEACGRDRE